MPGTRFSTDSLPHLCNDGYIYIQPNFRKGFNFQAPLEETELSDHELAFAAGPGLTVRLGLILSAGLGLMAGPGAEGLGLEFWQDKD